MPTVVVVGLGRMVRFEVGPLLKKFSNEKTTSSILPDGCCLAGRE